MSASEDNPSQRTPEPVLVTGTAGFIGFHLAQRLLDRGTPVVGVDNLNDYYDVGLKKARLGLLEGKPGFRFRAVDIAKRDEVEALFRDHPCPRVLHMAAQAGVRYSLVNPHAYGDSNLVGFLNVLEGCRSAKVRHLVYASSSSVYGANTKLPYAVSDNVDHPVSLYAATKKANELMAHAYAHLYRLPSTGLRLFTVYGPWGRPDMAYFAFTRAILEGRTISVFNHGKMMRDFTFVDDIAEAVLRVLDRLPVATETAPAKVYNVGNHQPVALLEFIGILEDLLGKTAVTVLKPLEPGDVEKTFADMKEFSRDFGFEPKTPLREGLRRFVAWYREYYASRN